MNRAQLALLDEIIDDLKAHPERHDQKEWVVFKGEEPPEVTTALDCGSAFCIAGAVAVRSGAKPRWIRSSYTGSGVDRWTAYTVVTPDGQDWGVATYAAKLLGIGADDADRLFYEHNTMQDIEDFRDELAAGVENREAAASELTTLAQDMSLDGERNSLGLTALENHELEGGE